MAMQKEDIERLIKENEMFRELPQEETYNEQYKPIEKENYDHEYGTD